MKIQIFSDLHLEWGMHTVQKHPEADVIIAAGDIHNGINGVKWLQEFAGDTPVVYICGNHEFYHNKIPKLYDTIREITKGSNIMFLQDSSVTLLGYTFYGCTLWTDMEYSKDGVNIGTNMFHARDIMNDYAKIRLSSQQAGYRKLRPSDTLRFHQNSVAHMRTNLQHVDKSKLIIVTHHLPLPQSLDPRVNEHDIDCAYASDLTTLVTELSPSVWIHGHVHCSNDYMLGTTRIVSNPFGYIGELPPYKNENFQPLLLL